MKILNINNVNKKEWDGFLLNNPYATFYQSYNFAILNKKLLNLEPSFIKFEDESGTTIGQLLLLLGKNFTLTRHSILEGFSLFLTKRVVPFVYWLDGPICSEGKMGPIIDQLDLYCKKRGFVVKNAVLPTIAASLEEKLREMHFQIRKNSTFIVDLNKTEDEAFSSLTKKARWAVRKAQEKGVVVRLAEDDDLEDYYELLISWKKSIGLSTYISYQQLKKQWQLLHPENMQVFLAYWNRKLVAAMGLLYFNGNMIEVMSAQSDVNKQNKLFAGYILKWSIIRWGIKNSMKTYDLAGVNPRPDATEKEKAIYQFKSKWGGLLTEKLVLTKNYSHLPFIK